MTVGSEGRLTIGSWRSHASGEGDISSGAGPDVVGEDAQGHPGPKKVMWPPACILEVHASPVGKIPIARASVKRELSGKLVDKFYI
jgi:hypothetical protein